MRDSFIIFTSYKDKLEVLNNEQMGELFKAILNYECDDSRKMPKIDDPVVNAVFYFIKSDLDNNYQKYQETCNKRQKNLDKANEKKNSANAMQSEDENCKRSANASLVGANADLLHSDNDNDNEHDNDNEYEKEKDKKEKAVRFSPPTLDEVITYCQIRGNNVDPEKWYDFYKSKGWMVGSNKMKDWKAAVRTWEKRENPKQPKEIPKYDQAFTDASLAISDADYEQFMKGRI